MFFLYLLPTLPMLSLQPKFGWLTHPPPPPTQKPAPSTCNDSKKALALFAAASVMELLILESFYWITKVLAKWDCRWTAGQIFTWPFLGRSLRGSMYNSPLPFTMAPLWMLLSSCDSLCQSVPVCASFPLILNPQTGCDRSPILHPCVAFHGQIAAFQHLFAPFHFLQEWLAVAFFFAP